MRPVVVIALAAYLAAGGYLYAFQRSFVFKPSGALTSPADAGLAGVSMQLVAMADGTDVPVWRMAPAMSDLPTVLYFHGNSGTLGKRAERFAEILDSGLGLYAPGYRGYAGAGGEPSEAGFVADALVHFDRLAAEGVRVVLHGESLGTGVASAVAAQRDAEALILEAPFTAAVDIAAAAYPWLPVGLLMHDQFKNRTHIANIEEPALIVHGTEDAVIPVAHGRKLFSLANEPKALIIVDGAGHGDLWSNGLWPNALGFLAENGIVKSERLSNR